MMMCRVATVAILLRVGFIAGVRRGLISQKKMPEMLRTRNRPQICHAYPTAMSTNAICMLYVHAHVHAP